MAVIVFAVNVMCMVCMVCSAFVTAVSLLRITVVSLQCALADDELLWEIPYKEFSTFRAIAEVIILM